MSVRFVNNFKAPLATGIASDDTEIPFPSGYGDTFRAKLGTDLGTDHVYMTLYNAGGDIEYVKVTATDDDDFTVTRGQDNTTARAWLAGDMAACRPNAAALQEAISLPTDLAHSGINLDITEMRGLTTPLSVSQGGTGVTSLSALLAALGVTFPLPVANGGTGVTSLSALKTAMSLTPGTDVMAYVAPGTSGNVLTSNGSAWTSAAPTSILTSATAQATTSGTAQNFSIPSWVKRITVMFKAVNASSVGHVYIQLGDSGGIETSGYVGNSSSYFDLSTSIAGVSGVVTLCKENGNTWCAFGLISGSDGDGIIAGHKTLSDTLTTLRVGTGSGFAAGEVNVMYE